MAPPRTIARLWRDAVVRYGDAAAFLVRGPDGWDPVSFHDAGERVELLAHGFSARGVGRGDAVAILARTSLEWALVDFALAQIGAVSAPVYATSADDDVRHVVEHSRSILVVCDDDAQAAKVERIASQLTRPVNVLRFADLAALESEGDEHRRAHPGAIAAIADTITEDDLYTLIYTSGTTGRSKGCMISHLNYHAMATAVVSIPEFGIGDSTETLLLYLPLAHNFGRLMMLLCPLRGVTVAFEPDPYRIADALIDVRPTVFPSVPRVYEKIYAGIETAFSDTTGAKRRLIEWALAVGRQTTALRSEGHRLPPGLALRHRVADRLVYAKVKARLGGRLRIPISGGAPLAAEIGRFFDALDVPLFEGYGLTECTSAATVNRPGATRYGTVGQALPGFELRVAEDGEVLLRSETVFGGYYDDPEATAEVLQPDGWIRTGDIGTLDADGFLTITDRKKDIIITSGGKNIAPQNIENDLKLSRYVSQALVVGDRRPYAVALLTLDLAEVGQWAEANGVATDRERLPGDERVRALVGSIVDEVNASRSRYEQVKRFAILPRDFELARDELTPTMKLRRRVCMEHFVEEIEALYATGGDG